VTFLKPNIKQPGIFLFDDTGTKFISGVIWLDSNEGVRAEIPFFDLDSSHEDIYDWFTESKPPENLLFLGDGVRVSLFGATVARHSMGSFVSMGGLRFHCAVNATYRGSLAKELRVASVRSEVDGLAYWTQLASVKMDISLEKGPAGRPQVKANYEVQVQHGLQWLQGEAKMSLQSTWKPSSDRPGIHLDDLVTLKSRFKTPRPVDDHLYHHRCFRDFITIIHGCGIYFRRHTARDQAFPYMTLDGSVHGAENVELICNRTVTDYGHPEPSSSALFQPILSIKSVTPKLLTTWAGKYKEWARAILPLVGVLQRSGLFVEVILVNASMSVEATGQLIGQVSGEWVTYGKNGSATTATYYFRLLEYSSIDLSRVSRSNQDSARALADVYNSVKHADRGPFPEFAFAHFGGQLALLLARISITKLLAPGNREIDSFASSWAIGSVLDNMTHSRVRIDSGKFRQ
jgi:hypothetical protein